MGLKQYLADQKSSDEEYIAKYGDARQERATRQPLGDRLYARGTRMQNAGKNLNGAGNTFLSLAFSVALLIIAVIVIAALLH